MTREEGTYYGQKVVEFTLDSGEVVWVRPLSFQLRQALFEKAEKRFPYPDPVPFEKKVDPERTAIPGAEMTIPADQNPEYQTLKRKVDIERMGWITDQIILLSCEFPAGKDTLIARYAERLNALGEVIDLSGDAWADTFNYCLIGSSADRQNIINAAESNLQLTEAEVRDALRIFRPVLRRNADPGGAGQAPA